MKQKSKKKSLNKLEMLKLGQTLMASKQRSNIDQGKIPSMSEVIAKIKRKQQSSAGKMFPMPYEQPQRAKYNQQHKLKLLTI